MSQSQVAGKENITDNMEKFSLKVCKYMCIYNRWHVYTYMQKVPIYYTCAILSALYAYNTPHTATIQFTLRMFIVWFLSHWKFEPLHLHICLIYLYLSALVFVCRAPARKFWRRIPVTFAKCRLPPKTRTTALRTLAQLWTRLQHLLTLRWNLCCVKILVALLFSQFNITTSGKCTKR